MAWLIALALVLLATGAGLNGGMSFGYVIVLVIAAAIGAMAQRSK